MGLFGKGSSEPKDALMELLKGIRETLKHEGHTGGPDCPGCKAEAAKVETLAIIRDHPHLATAIDNAKTTEANMSAERDEMVDRHLNEAEELMKRKDKTYQEAWDRIEHELNCINLLPPRYKKGRDELSFENGALLVKYND